LIGLGIDSSRVNRIPPGVDSELFKPATKADAPQLILFSGLKSYKRPLDALFVLKGLLEEFPGATLVVCGRGPLDTTMRATARNLGLEAHVKLTGWVTGRELAEQVAQSWVNLHFSRAEGWGYSICEAAAAGTPTVAYDAPGVSEVVTDYSTGTVVPEGDVGAGARAVSSLLRKGRIRSETLRANVSELSWDRTAAAWEHLLSGADA